MSKTAKRLGRGLESLVSNLRGGGDLPPQQAAATQLPPAPATASKPEIAADSAAPPRQAITAPADRVPSGGSGLVQLPIEKLQPNPYQPRVNMDDKALASLVASIRRSGILQPITVRMRDGRHEIIAGERRWTAARICGLATVPVVLRDADDEQMLELALIENIQREDLNPIDRAKAYKRFCSRFSFKADDLADRLGEDRSTVSNYLRILELSQPIQELVASGRLGMGHGRCLLGIPDARRREALATDCVAHDWSVRTLEQMVRSAKTDSGAGAIVPPKPTIAKASPHLRDLQHKFEQAVKTKVTIHEGRRKGSGRIVIEYYSLDDFDRIATALGVDTDSH